MNIVILGPQGSGKGTQAKLLAEKMGLYYFDMGAFLRELAGKDENIRRIQNKGILIPDDMFFFAMKELLRGKISTGVGMILDGFPRTVAQYEILKNWFNENGFKIDKVIFLGITEEETIKRLTARRTCSECGSIYNLVFSPKPKSPDVCDKCGGKLIQRSDDRPEVIKKRLAVFQKETMPILDLARKDGILLKVDGEQLIEKVTKDILEGFKNNG